jgi:hypothetical protein
MRSAVVRVPTSAAVGVLAVIAASCGVNVQPADLFLLQRTGQGKTLTLLVRDDGTIRCNGHTGKALSDAQLLQARDLESSLDTDAKTPLRPAAVGRVYTYSIKLPDGTITFGDTAAAAHKELGQAELFATQVFESGCS